MVARSSQQAAGLWSLVGDLTELARWDVGPATVVVPTEDVLLLAVELPMAGLARRRAALPFAVEDRIADPLDAVHIVLGEGLTATTCLVGVVRHDVMAGWVARLAAAGLDHARIVPDALVLPSPATGTWHVTGSGDRIVARTDAGTGFAAPAACFAALWAAGGSLPCVVFGGSLPVELPLATGVGDASPAAAAGSSATVAPGSSPARVVSAPGTEAIGQTGVPAAGALPDHSLTGALPHDDDVPSPADAAGPLLFDAAGVPGEAGALPPAFGRSAPPLDLRAGPYAAPLGALPRTARRAAAVVGFGLLSYTALLAVDAQAAAAVAAQRRTATTALVRATLPGTSLVDLDRVLPGGHGRLLPLLVQTAAALAPVGGLGWSRLGWSAADDRLTLGVEAGDLGGLQRAQAALAAAGLDPASGAVTAGDNRADGDFVIRAHDA